MRKVLSVTSLALSLGACVQQLPPSDVVGLAPPQIKAAAARSDTPAGVSTVEFKELGDTKRYAVIARLVGKTWDDACRPTSVQIRGYSPNGSSQWDVHCKGSLITRDYLVALPERARDDARVLKCRMVDPRVNTCSIIGSSETAGVRTADAR